jgi:hypothetical protein
MWCSRAPEDVSPWRHIMSRFITDLIEARRGGRAASSTKLPMKTLVLAFSLGTLLCAANFIQPANAQDLDAARAQALRECNLMEKTQPHDPYEGTKSGGRMFHYKACMAVRGQID